MFRRILITKSFIIDKNKSLQIQNNETQRKAERKKENKINHFDFYSEAANIRRL